MGNEYEFCNFLATGATIRFLWGWENVLEKISRARFCRGKISRTGVNAKVRFVLEANKKTGSRRGRKK